MAGTNCLKWIVTDRYARDVRSLRSRCPLATLAALLRTDKSPPNKGGFSIGTPRSPSALALRSRPPHSPLIAHPPTPFACASALALRPCPPPSPSALAHQTARYARGLATPNKTTLRRCRLAPASTLVSAGAPPPPHPRGLRLPLRGAVSVLGVTACGMIAAPLSREVTLLRTAPSPDGLRGLWSGRPLFRHRAVAATPARRLQFRFRSFFRLLPGVAAGR